jgi:lambda family phage portal protein
LLRKPLAPACDDASRRAAMTLPAILDSSGAPMTPAPRSAPAPRPRAGLSGEYRNFFPYDAASWFTNESQDWFPWIRSPDNEINIYRDRMVARVRDLVRNDGWAAGGITGVLDSTIGGYYRLISNPDHAWLKRRYGAAFDHVWADEYRQAVEAEWRGWADDPNFYCDATRQLTMSQIFYLALRHKLVDGEPLAMLDWMPERQGYGAATYATAVKLIDPDRLSNPYEMVDTMHRRGGVEIDDDGAPVGYHIRRAHQNDWYAAVQSMEWDYAARETEWGRPIVLHDLDRDRVEQHRGLSVLTPVLNRFKMLTTYDRAELQAAVVNAIYALAVESPYDPKGLREAMGDGEQIDDLRFYWDELAASRKSRGLKLDGVQIAHFFPGEKAVPLNPTRPNANYDPFSHAVLRHVASALGTSAAQMTKDWSKTNYSSARSEILDAWKTMSRRRVHFDTGFSNRVYMGWLEEAHEIAPLPLPPGAPDFAEARAAYARCRWLGAARGWVDPVKEAQGAALRMDAATSTLLEECAEQGKDWEEQLAQRSIEARKMKELKIPLPAWIAGIPAQTAEEKPLAQ